MSTSAGTFASAQVIGAASFTNNALADVFDSTTIKHAEISQNGRQSAGYDFYRFTHGGGTMHLDIDTASLTSGRFDTEIGIWNAAGSLLFINDDNVADPGSPDIGGGSSLDSLLQGLSLASGDYIVGVCAFPCGFAANGVITGEGVPDGGRYILNISSNVVGTVPEPGALSLMLLAGAGAFASRRRKA